MKAILKNNSIISFLVLWLSCSASIILLIFDSGKIPASVVLIVLSGMLLFIFRKNLHLYYITEVRKADVYLYVLSILICFGGVIFSFVRNEFYSAVWSLSWRIGISYSILNIIIHLILSLASFPFLCFSVIFIVKDTMQINPGIIKENKQWVKSWLILSLAYCLSILTIIRANYIYKDDMQRIINGMTIYTRESRFLAEYILGFLETSSFFADISPLTQLMEMCLMALSAVIVFKVISEKVKAEFWDYIGMLSFGIFPYFLEPVSFRYDSPQHAVAVFFAVLPLLFYRRDSIKYIIITSLCITLSCSSHQVPMTVFPMLVILLCIINGNTGRQTWQQLKSFVLTSICGYGAGLAFYRLFIMQPIGYNASLTTILPLSKLIPGMIKNYADFFNCILSDYNSLWLILTALIFVYFYVSVVRHSVIGKWKSLFLTGSGIILMLLLSNSLYPLLEAPLHNARHMYSFGIFTGIVTIAAVSFCEQRAILAKSCAVILSLCYISFAFIYGNMLSYQANYTSFRIQMVIDDLNEYPVFQEKDTVKAQIIGGTGFSPVVQSHIGHYPLLSRLVTTSFNDYFGDWYATDLYNLYGLNALYNPPVDGDFQELNMPKIKDTYYYNLYSDGDKFLIELKERSDTAWYN